MRKFVFAIVFLAVAGGLAWLAWFRPAAPEEAEKKPETEVPVHVGKIQRATLRGYVAAYGTVEAQPPGERPAASALVASPVAGVVSEVNCAEGQPVEKGTVLFRLDSRAIDVAVDKAHRTAEFVERNVERQRRLMQVEGTSQKLLLEAEQALTVARSELAAAQIQQALLRVESPLTGTVVRVNARPGEAVDSTTAMAEVIDLDRLVVSANVPAGELPALKAGQPAEVRAGQAAEPIRGVLTFISPQIDPKTGTALVRATLPAHTGLRPGQFVTLRIGSEEHQDRLTVPVESLAKDAEGGTVIAVVANGKAVQRPVKAGLREGGLVEIEGEGLEVGMFVVTEGAYALPKETKVRVVEK